MLKIKYLLEKLKIKPTVFITFLLALGAMIWFANIYLYRTRATSAGQVEGKLLFDNGKSSLRLENTKDFKIKVYFIMDGSEKLSGFDIKLNYDGNLMKIYDLPYPGRAVLHCNNNTERRFETIIGSSWGGGMRLAGVSKTSTVSLPGGTCYLSLNGKWTGDAGTTDIKAISSSWKAGGFNVVNTDISMQNDKISVTYSPASPTNTPTTTPTPTITPTPTPVPPGNTITVCPTGTAGQGGCDYIGGGGIQEAVDYALNSDKSGFTIILKEGSYKPSTNNNAVKINKDVSKTIFIIGDSEQGTVIDGSNAGKNCVHIGGTGLSVNLEKLTIKNCKEDGVLVQAHAKVRLSHVTVTRTNSNDVGYGAIEITSPDKTNPTTVTLSSCTIINNNKSGVNYYVQSLGDITGCVVQGNKANGVEYHSSRGAIKESVLKNNSKNGVYSNNSEVSVERSKLLHNGLAGVFFVDNSSGVVSQSTFKDNNYAVQIQSLGNHSLDVKKIITVNNNEALRCEDNPSAFYSLNSQNGILSIGEGDNLEPLGNCGINGGVEHGVIRKKGNSSILKNDLHFNQKACNALADNEKQALSWGTYPENPSTFCPDSNPTNTPTPTPVPPGLCSSWEHGDINCQDGVNSDDYSILFYELQSGCDIADNEVGCGMDKNGDGNVVDSDYNHDGKVTIEDYVLWFALYNRYKTGS